VQAVAFRQVAFIEREEMRVTKSNWIAVGQIIYIALVAIGTSYAVGFATQANLLLWLAVPLGAVLIGLLAWLPARPQLLGWGAVTVWLLATTYLGTSDIEYVALAIVVLLTLAGLFWSPWFLVGVWVFHPMWDLIPRELPDQMHDLPLACLIYDLMVAGYLAWRSRRGFFVAVGPSDSNARGILSSGWKRFVLALVALVIMVTQILIVGSVMMDPNALWYAFAVALALTLAVTWMPRAAQLSFWAVATGWMGMTYAHSGLPLEVALFLVLLALAVFGFSVSPWYLVIAWALHAVWNFLPHAHDMASAQLMGHWMDPNAAFAYEISIAVYLVIAMKWGRLKRDTPGIRQ
jgi:type IV secretory pathway VirB3-like protein